MESRDIREKLVEVFGEENVVFVKEEETGEKELPDTVSGLLRVAAEIIERDNAASWLLEEYGLDKALILTFITMDLQTHIHEMAEKPKKGKRHSIDDFLDEVFQ